MITCWRHCSHCTATTESLKRVNLHKQLNFHWLTLFLVLASLIARLSCLSRMGRNKQWDNYNIHLHKYTVKAAALVRIKLDSFGIEHTGRRVTCKTSGEYALVKETGYTINIWSFRIPLWDKHSSKNGKRVHFSSVVKKLPDTLINRWLTKCDYCLKLNSF